MEAFGPVRDLRRAVRFGSFLALFSRWLRMLSWRARSVGFLFPPGYPFESGDGLRGGFILIDHEEGQSRKGNDFPHLQTLSF